MDLIASYASSGVEIFSHLTSCLMRTSATIITGGSYNHEQPRRREVRLTVRVADPQSLPAQTHLSGSRSSYPVKASFRKALGRPSCTVDSWSIAMTEVGMMRNERQNQEIHNPGTTIYDDLVAKRKGVGVIYIKSQIWRCNVVQREIHESTLVDPGDNLSISAWTSSQNHSTRFHPCRRVDPTTHREARHTVMPILVRDTVSTGDNMLE